MGRLPDKVKIYYKDNLAQVNGDGALNVTFVEELTTFSADYSGAQTDQTIITPSTGKKLHISGVYVSTSTINVDITLAFATSGDVIFKLYTAQRASQAGIPCHHDGAVNEVLKLTCGANTFVCVTYREHA